MGIEDIYWITPEFSVIVAGVVGRDNQGCGRGHGRLPSYRI